MNMASLKVIFGNKKESVFFVKIIANCFLVSLPALFTQYFVDVFFVINQVEGIWCSFHK